MLKSFPDLAGSFHEQGATVKSTPSVGPLQQAILDYLAAHPGPVPDGDPALWIADTPPLHRAGRREIPLRAGGEREDALHPDRAQPRAVQGASSP